jgi:hypothetical protein
VACATKPCAIFSTSCRFSSSIGSTCAQNRKRELEHSMTEQLFVHASEQHITNWQSSDHMQVVSRA